MTKQTKQVELEVIYGVSHIDKNGKKYVDIKYQKWGCCDDCGKEFHPPLNRKILEEQHKQKDNFYFRISCDECINKNHTLTDEELGLIKKE